MKILVISAALISITIQPAFAQQQAATPALAPQATQSEIQQLQILNQQFADPNSATQQSTPEIMPQSENITDDEGQIGSYMPNGPVDTPGSPFFKVLGTNGRTCFTCHEPQNGWGLGQESATNRFAANPADPLFRLVDGATCPDDDVSTPAAAAQAYSLLTAKGLIRISLPMQGSMQFQIVSVQDTNGSDCNTNPTTGLTGPQSGFLNFYRRPLPTSGLGFLSNIMWDTREPSLEHQALDATTGHAQATAVPSSQTLDHIVNFEGCMNAATPDFCNGINPGGETGGGTFAAQAVDTNAPPAGAGDLTGADGYGATGGPKSLFAKLAKFAECINDPFGCNGQSFNSAIFDIYNAWGALSGTDAATQAKQAIFRGQQVFNTVQFQITGVNGLNDVQEKPSITGTCGTCHNNPDVGNHSSNLTLNIGVTGAGSAAPPNLDISGLPVFTVVCTAGPQAGQTFTVTDLGVAMVSGQCADIGKTKIPIIRGIAARSPYFHNGAALEITNLVDFYNQRFNIGLTDQQKADLAVFLEAL